MNLPVYALYIESENSSSVYLDDERYDDFYERYFIGKEMAKDWEPPPFKIDDPNLSLKDFVAGTLMAPLVSEKSKRALFHLLRNHAEFLPCMDIKNIPYYVLNVTRLVDCIDLNNSEVSYHPTEPGRILNIMQFRFQEDKIENVPVFKVPQDTGIIFVRRPFVDVVIKERITGVGVEDPSNMTFMKDHVSGVEGLPVKSRSG